REALNSARLTSVSASPACPARHAPLVWQVGAVANPLGRDDGQPLGHLVEWKRVLGTQLRELLPGGLLWPAAVARLSSACDRFVELLAFNIWFCRASQAEI